MTPLDNPSQEDWFDIWAKVLIDNGYISKILKASEMEPMPLFEGLFKEISYTKVLYKGTKREQIKTYTKKITILEPIKYTPDRFIIWAEKAQNLLFTDLESYNNEGPYFIAKNYKGKYISLIEIKAPAGYGGRNTSDASFRVKQKWLYEKYKLYTQKIMLYPNSKKSVNPRNYLWLSTFTPGRYLFTDKLTKNRTISNWDPVLFKTFTSR